MNRHLFVTLLLLATSTARADELLVRPFVQHVTPDSAWLVWETDTDGDATVRWGAGPAAEDPVLSEEVTSTRRATEAGTWIHEAELTGLTASSRFSYAVVLADETTATGDFDTAPDGDSATSFRIVAASDMQAAATAPGKWGEVVNDGMLAWARAEVGDDVASAFAMALLPGDLVDDGPDHERWLDEFFGPAAALSAHVPLYPVLGNHESNTHWYFDYFHLPEDGDPSLPEQWWSHPYGNVLVLGLDSNLILRWADQMTWLDAQLDRACTDPSVDFVIAQLHHPWRSEQWVPGESPLTGQLVEKLAAFSTTCGPPSLHLFGHTHAYSRGQLRDATHLMLNVASGGGALDRWGEQSQRNDPQFSVSTDDWGFVVIDVTAGDDPSLRVRRYSRGDAGETLDNVLVDDLTVFRFPDPPATPTPPAGERVDDGACVTLDGGPFDDDGAQQATHWQLLADCDSASVDFSVPTREVWRQDHDLWFDVDPNAGDDLTDEDFRGLSAGAWCWRVRYRNASLAWSDWSAVQTLDVRDTTSTDNLLTDPGAEADTRGWDVALGTLEVTGAGRCDAPRPHSGSRAFALGGRCAVAPESTAEQTVTLPLDRDGLDTLRLSLTHRGDVPLEVTITLRDAVQAVVGAPVTWTSPATSDWADATWSVPVGDETRVATVTLHAVGTVDVDTVDLSLAADGEAALRCAPPAATEATEAPPGCQCDSGGSGAPLAGLAAAALLWRRRRAMT